MPGMLDGTRRQKAVVWVITVVLVVLVGGFGALAMLSYSH
jgi:hypothetical protein